MLYIVVYIYISVYIYTILYIYLYIYIPAAQLNRKQLFLLNYWLGNIG